MDASECRTEDVPSRNIRWVNGALFIALFFVSLYQFLHFGGLAIDDAYISYRYAAMLARGDGLVFNPGEWVQGFTNPLHTLLLAAFGAAGVAIPKAGIGIGVAASWITAGSLILLGGRPLLGAVAGAGLLLVPAFAMNALSGMETMLFCMLLMGVIAAFCRGLWIPLGILLGLLLMTRPDGAFWAIPIGLFLLVVDRRALVKTVVAAVVVYGSWMAVAWFLYGSPIPQSILAKKLIHPAPFEQVLEVYQRFLTRGRGMRILWVVAGLGLLIEIVRRRRIAVIGIAAVFYIVGLASSRILPIEVPRYFLWYAIPVIPVGFLFATRAAVGVVDLFKGRRWALVPALAIVGLPTVLALEGHLLLRHAEFPKISRHFVTREALYELTAQEINRRADGKVVDVLVGEVGVLGYYLLDHRVHDSAGINSKEIYRYRLDDRQRLEEKGTAPRAALWEGTQEWVLGFVDDHRPDFVTTLMPYLRMKQVSKNPRFLDSYEPIETEKLWQGGNTVFQRRDPE